MVTEADLRNLVDLAKRAEAKTIDAGACGGRWDRAEARKAEEELQDELHRLIEWVSFIGAED